VTGDIFVMQPPLQTLKAWDPFWDCVSVLFEFQNSDVADGSEEITNWRLFWVAGVALLRTVGHVLAKVDSKGSRHQQQAIGSLWAEWNADRESSAIFWNFIEEERNNLLKTYSFGAQFAYDGYLASIVFRDGSDAFQLYRQAVYWWREQLMKLEAKIAAKPSPVESGC
jgi:hypothetical protein